MKKNKSKGTVLYYLSYVFGDIFNKAMPFLLLPFLTRILTQEEYGHVAEFTSIFNLCFLLGTFSCLAFHRKVFFENKSLESVISTSSILSIITIILVCTVFFIIPKYTSYLMFLDINYIFLIALGTFSLVVNRITTNYFNCSYMLGYYFLFNFVSTLINLILTYVLLIHFNLPINARIVAISLAPVFVFPLSIYFLNKNVGITFKSSFFSFKKQMKFALPLFLFQVSSWAKTSIDKVIISSNLDYGILGVYSANSQLALIIFVIFTSLNVALSPKILTLMKIDLKKSFHFVHKCILIFTIVYILVVPCIYVFSPFVLGIEFSFDPYILIFLSLSFLFNGYTMLLNHYLIQLGGGGWLSFISVICTFLYMAIMLLAIADYGFSAILVSSLFTSILLFILTYIKVKKVISAPLVEL